MNDRLIEQGKPETNLKTTKGTIRKDQKDVTRRGDSNKRMFRFPISRPQQLIALVQERQEQQQREQMEFHETWGLRKVENVVKRYGLLVNLKAKVEQLRSSHLTRELETRGEEDLLFFFRDELSCQELNKLFLFFQHYDEIQEWKSGLEHMQTLVLQDKTVCQDRDNQRRSLVNALSQVLSEPWRDLVSRMEQVKLACWRNRLLQVENLVDEPTSVDELLRGLANVLEEVARWKRRHDPEQWKQSSEENLTRLRTATCREGFDFFDRDSLFSVDDQIVKTFLAFRDEEIKLGKDEPSSDWPKAATSTILGKLRSFVTRQLPDLLQQVAAKVTELEENYEFFSTGLEAPQTQRMKHLLEKLHTVENQRMELKFALQNLQTQRTRGKAVDESEIRSLQGQLESGRLEKTNLSLAVRTERTELMELTKNHYPELLLNDEFRNSLGLNDFPEADELYQSVLYMDSLTPSDFVTESNLSHSAGKRVDIVLDTSGHRKVLKTFALLHDEARGDFVRQCSAFSKLRHANIVRVEGVFTDVNGGYIVMPLYPGGDLEKWLEDHPVGARDTMVCKQIAFDILNGLYTIHSHGHVHCDLTPANVFLTQTNRGVIGHFDGVKMENRTCTSNLQTTRDYLAPELRNANLRNVSSSVDMFSFGLILKELFPDAGTQCRALIDTLLSIDPKLRPSAYDALTHEFFSAKPEPVRDCAMCLHKFREADTVSCGAGHVCCATCISGWLKSGLPKPHVDSTGDIMCFDPCCGQNFNSVDLFGLKSDVSSILVEKVKELEHVKLQQEYEARLQTELSKNIEDTTLKRHRNYILDEILTLSCPSCKKAFVDFDACFAISCRDSAGNGCGTKFCAWCLKICGTDSQVAHRHVATCTRNRSRESDVLFGDRRLYELEMNQLRAERLNEYWTEKISQEKESIRQTLRETVQQFQDKFNVDILRLN